MSRKPVNWKTVKELESRFDWGSLILGAALVLSFIMLLFDPDEFYDVQMFIGVGVAMWFLADYKLLQGRRIYYYCIGLAVLFAIIQWIIVLAIPNPDPWRSKFAATAPLGLLAVQLPLRHLFKEIFDREPVVDRPAPSGWDAVYAMILSFSVILVPALIMTLIKQFTGD